MSSGRTHILIFILLLIVTIACICFNNTRGGIYVDNK